MKQLPFNEVGVAMVLEGKPYRYPNTRLIAKPGTYLTPTGYPVYNSDRASVLCAKNSPGSAHHSPATPCLMSIKDECRRSVAQAPSRTHLNKVGLKTNLACHQCGLTWPSDAWHAPWQCPFTGASLKDSVLEWDRWFAGAAKSARLPGQSRVQHERPATGLHSMKEAGLRARWLQSTPGARLNSTPFEVEGSILLSTPAKLFSQTTPPRPPFQLDNALRGRAEIGFCLGYYTTPEVRTYQCIHDSVRDAHSQQMRWSDEVWVYDTPSWLGEQDATPISNRARLQLLSMPRPSSSQSAPPVSPVPPSLPASSHQNPHPSQPCYPTLV